MLEEIVSGISKKQHFSVWEEAIAATLYLLKKELNGNVYEADTAQRIAVLLAGLRSLSPRWGRELALEVLLR